MSTLSLVRRDGISRQRDGRRAGRHVAVQSRLKALNARMLGGNTPASAVRCGIHRMYPHIPDNVFAIHGV